MRRANQLGVATGNKVDSESSMIALVPVDGVVEANNNGNRKAKVSIRNIMRPNEAVNKSRICAAAQICGR